MRTISRHAADQAATARAPGLFTSGLFRQRRRRGRGVGRLDVAPAECILVVQLDLVESRLRNGPGSGVFDEEIPIRLPLREALRERGRLLVDGANAEPAAERLRLMADA